MRFIFRYPPKARGQSLANKGGRDVSFFRFRERERGSFGNLERHGGTN